jgi:hypothetical protein
VVAEPSSNIAGASLHALKGENVSCYLHHAAHSPGH